MTADRIDVDEYAEFLQKWVVVTPLKYRTSEAATRLGIEQRARRPEFTREDLCHVAWRLREGVSWDGWCYRTRAVGRASDALIGALLGVSRTTALRLARRGEQDNIDPWSPCAHDVQGKPCGREPDHDGPCVPEVRDNAAYVRRFADEQDEYEAREAVTLASGSPS